MSSSAGLVLAESVYGANVRDKLDVTVERMHSVSLAGHSKSASAALGARINP